MLKDTVKELRSLVARSTYKHTPYVMLRKEYLYSLLDRLEHDADPVGTSIASFTHAFEGFKAEEDYTRNSTRNASI